MRFPRRIGASLVLVFLCAAALCQDSRSSRAALRSLHTAREAHGLSQKEAARAYPVRLRAVVTYYDPYIDTRHGALFVRDATGSIFVSVPLRPILPLHAGTLVEIVAVTAPGDFAPILDRASVTVVGESQVPQNPPRATAEQLRSGSQDGQWVEVEGLVRSVRLTPTNAIIRIATVGGPISATTVREHGANYDTLVDSLILIHGNAAPVFNRKMQMVGVHLYFPSLREIKVEQPAPADAFAMPPLPISSLLQFTPGLKLTRRVHIQGRVTLQWPGRTLCVQQESDGLCMQIADAARVNAGDLLDVVGFPAVSAYRPTMEDAIFRVAGGQRVPPVAKTIVAAQAFSGDHDGELVRIDGEIIAQDRTTSNLTLLLRSGSFLFLAILPRDSALPPILPWKDGSLLRLTGICSVQVNSESTNSGEGGVRPGAVHILLRSVADVTVLKVPSWWTPRHALAVLVVVAVLAFSALAWVVVLRRRVDQQIQALRTSEERLRHLSQHDALTGLPNRILLNDRLNMALHRHKRFGSMVGLLMIDVDRFKEVNDALGHLAGDQILCHVANRIAESVRKTDTVARMGGDEFVVLLPDLHSPKEAEMLAAKIVSAVSDPHGPVPLERPITVSVGVCVCPEGGTEDETMLHSADAAMYSAKTLGRNGLQVFRRDMVSSMLK